MMVLDDAISFGQRRPPTGGPGRCPCSALRAGDNPLAAQIPENEQWTEAEMLAYEKATLGFT